MKFWVRPVSIKRTNLQKSSTEKPAFDCPTVMSMERSATKGQLPQLNPRVIMQITIAKVIPHLDCHISRYRLKMHTSDNFQDIHNGDINPFTLSNRREMCSLESFSSRGCLRWSCFVYMRLPLWQNRPCIATYSLRKATLNWSWWYQFNCGKFCFKRYMVWLLRPKWLW